MSSVIEKLQDEVKIPYDEESIKSGDPVLLAEYQLVLVKTLQELLSNITTVLNYAVDMSDGEAIYLGLKDSTGEYPDNTWRFIPIGGALEIQKKLSGEWVKIAKHNN